MKLNLGKRSMASARKVEREVKITYILVPVEEGHDQCDTCCFCIDDTCTSPNGKEFNCDQITSCAYNWQKEVINGNE